jgi:hypothetical protein
MGKAIGAALIGAAGAIIAAVISLHGNGGSPAPSAPLPPPAPASTAVQQPLTAPVTPAPTPVLLAPTPATDIPKTANEAAARFGGVPGRWYKSVGCDPRCWWQYNDYDGPAISLTVPDGTYVAACTVSPNPRPPYCDPDFPAARFGAGQTVVSGWFYILWQ